MALYAVKVDGYRVDEITTDKPITSQHENDRLIYRWAENMAISWRGVRLKRLDVVKEQAKG